MNKRDRISILLALMVIVVTGGALVLAQTGGVYSLTWSTVDGGGGASSGGSYSLAGTAGQPDAASVSGGSYTLLGGFWGGIGSSGTTNNPGSFNFSGVTYTVLEGSSATITVNRTGGSSGAASVDYATSNGTATAGSDYTAVSGTLNFADGETSKTFSVTTLSDAVNDPDETVTLTLSNVTGGASLGTTTQATLTISQSGYKVYLPAILR